MSWQNSSLGSLWYTRPATIDQCHEQNNTVVKGSGGAEIARITTEFEEQVIRGHGGAHDIWHLHHDQKPGVQAAFKKDVRALIAVFEDMGNPLIQET